MLKMSSSFMTRALHPSAGSSPATKTDERNDIMHTNFGGSNDNRNEMTPQLVTAKSMFRKQSGPK